jgi:hypothetical protein
MFAARLLAMNTWKNVAMPIWERIQPSSTMKITALLVCVKMPLLRKKYPKR